MRNRARMIATAAVIAAWPCRSSADLAVAGAVGLAPVVDAIAAALPAARATLTVAAAAMILVRLCMRTLLGLGVCPKGTKLDSGRPKRFLTAA